MRNLIPALFIWASFCHAQPVDPDLGSVLISGQAIVNSIFNPNSAAILPELAIQKADLIKWLKTESAKHEIINIVSSAKETVYYPYAIKRILGPGNFDLITIICPYSNDNIRIYLSQGGRLVYRVNSQLWLNSKVNIPHDEKIKFNKGLTNSYNIKYSHPDLTQVSFDMAEGDYPGGIFIRYPVFDSENNNHIGWLALTYLVNAKKPIDFHFTYLAKK